VIYNCSTSLDLLKFFLVLLQLLSFSFSGPYFIWVLQVIYRLWPDETRLSVCSVWVWDTFTSGRYVMWRI
jgi:hypothetical protein